jgi:hypothetical protein
MSLWISTVTYWQLQYSSTSRKPLTQRFILAYSVDFQTLVKVIVSFLHNRKFKISVEAGFFHAQKNSGRCTSRLCPCSRHFDFILLCVCARARAACVRTRKSERERDTWTLCCQQIITWPHCCEVLVWPLEYEDQWKEISCIISFQLIQYSVQTPMW